MTSEDNETWTIRIDESATFPDGSPVDAEAVAATFERGREVPDSPNAAFYDTIIAVEADDDLTVSVELSRPNPSFPRELAGLTGMVMPPGRSDDEVAAGPSGIGSVRL